MSKADRIAARFAALKEEGRTGLVTFVTAGDPDIRTGQEILEILPRSGADFIEIGMPFSDPMADGPAIQAASQRALKGHACMKTTLEAVRRFRVNDTETPVILMGYFNPIYAYGTERFVEDATESGVDGVIVVDLPPEEDGEFRKPANDAGLKLVRLVTPTTDDARLAIIAAGAGGFLYYVSITGVTGTAHADAGALRPRLAHIRGRVPLPVAVGFGINTPEEAAAMAGAADAVVVGSAIVRTIAGIAEGTRSVADVGAQVEELRAALRQGRS